MHDVCCVQHKQFKYNLQKNNLMLRLAVLNWNQTLCVFVCECVVDL